MKENSNTFLFSFQENCSLILEMAKHVDESNLNKNDRVTLRVLIDQLETYVDGYNWRM